MGSTSPDNPLPKTTILIRTSKGSTEFIPESHLAIKFAINWPITPLNAKSGNTGIKINHLKIKES
jgi:hypothetical protein